MEENNLSYRTVRSVTSKFLVIVVPKINEIDDYLDFIYLGSCDHSLVVKPVTFNHVTWVRFPVIAQSIH